MIAGVGIFVAADLYHLNKYGGLPHLKEIWLFSLIVPLVCGAAVTVGAGGAVIWNRVIGAAICAAAVGVFSTLISSTLGAGDAIGFSEIVVVGLWRIFIFTILSVVGLLFTEINLPEPEMN